MNFDKEENEKLAKYSLLLILFENGLGSLLHSIQLPLAGHALSINQIGILSKLTLDIQKKDAPLIVSFNAMVLKSLSPAGKKLTPMLAILAQGLLFNLPLLIFGLNPLAIVMGIILSSIWAFLQPALFLYLMFGSDLIKILAKLLKDISHYIPNIEQYGLAIITALILIKILLALLYSFFLVRINDEKFKQLTAKIESYKKTTNDLSKRTDANFKNSLRELFSPLFILSLIVSLLFFIYADASFSTIVWGMFRPIAIGLIIFYSIKIFPMENVVIYLKRHNFNRLANSLEGTIKLFSNSK